MILDHSSRQRTQNREQTSVYNMNKIEIPNKEGEKIGFARTI